MSTRRFHVRTASRAVLMVMVFALFSAARPALAEYPVTTAATLIDRAQIEDLLVDYYWHFSNQGVDFSAYFAADGVLEVNGVVSKGVDEIKNLYRRTYAFEPPPSQGRFFMLISNLKIRVDGNEASADLVWTNMADVERAKKPIVTQQGREHDELVKQNGRWLIKSRVITTDGGYVGKIP